MLSKDEAFRLTRFSFDDIADSASAIRDEASLHSITYSPKVFLPLTHLCQDNCSYCTFAKAPSAVDELYMTVEQIREVCALGIQNQCSEALFTLGEAPERRYEEAGIWLKQNGYSTTTDYLADMARIVITEFGGG
jgi:FO synthase